MKFSAIARRLFYQASASEVIQHIRALGLLGLMENQ
jgi:hypothetical protein